MRDSQPSTVPDFVGESHHSYANLPAYVPFRRALRMVEVHSMKWKSMTLVVTPSDSQDIPLCQYK